MKRRNKTTTAKDLSQWWSLLGNYLANWRVTFPRIGIQCVTYSKGKMPTFNCKLTRTLFPSSFGYRIKAITGNDYVVHIISTKFQSDTIRKWCRSVQSCVRCSLVSVTTSYAQELIGSYMMNIVTQWFVFIWIWYCIDPFQCINSVNGALRFNHL